ncbi:MAG: tetratricopeptide repeat protein [Acidobacteriia bacterium]|nr:tetratricopeptide repeat protein [Terriglobia bacterium]
MPLSLRGFLLFLSSLLALSPLQAQAPGPAPVLGHISFPTSGSPKAQPSFIRGVLLLHSFEYDDAIAAFREAERLDPGFAMAYWGEAMCFNQPLWRNEDVAKARAALTRLAPTPVERQGKAPTAREKGYLDAVERLYGLRGGGPGVNNVGNQTARDAVYADRMAELSRQYPQDDEAAAFYALALLATIPENERNTAVSLKAGAIASAILKRNPEHPGAAHYALHAYDDGEHAAMGLQAARTYARIAPASSHALHMPSHVFLPLGLWDEAVASDEHSFAVSVDRVKRLKLSMAQADFHSLSWLQYEYLQQGRFSKARSAMATVEDALRASVSQKAEGRSQNSAETHQHAESEIGRGFGTLSLKNELASMKARLVVESGVWADMKGQSSFDNVEELFALGMASIGLGDAARADAAIEHMKTAVTAIPDPDAREVAQIMSVELDGLRRLSRGDQAGALAALAQAAAMESRRPKPIARPYPIKPAHEFYGEILLGTGDAAKAVTEFETALARSPRRAVPLLGLARAYEVLGRHADAQRTAKEFLQVWHLADADRPELAEMRALAR